MDNKFSLGLIRTMDRLWFQQIILFPETLEPKQPYSESTSTSTISSSSSLSLSSDANQDKPAPVNNILYIYFLFLLLFFMVIHSIGCGSRRASLVSRSHSSSSTQKRMRIHHQCELQNSMSCTCRSLKDLELEEVKGFKDLGFIFTKEHLNPRMIRVVPGLLRLGFLGSKRVKSEVNVAADEQEEKKRGFVIRPYLSEAWLIKRPHSPLMNPRVSKGSASADHMKKHLKFWDRAVGSLVQQI